MTNATVAAIRPPFNHIVAFEVSKESLVVHALPSDKQLTIANTPAAVRRLLAAERRSNARQELGPMLVVVEATGGYERGVLDVAVALGIPAHRAHGTRVRHFARYLGLAAKTDAIDARVLAAFGRQAQDLRLYRPPPPASAALRELQGRRSELQDMMLAETNRLEHVRLPDVRKSLERHIAALKVQVKQIEAAIAALVRADALLRTKSALMRSVVGVGPVTAATLLAYLPDIGQMTRGQVARLAGLAPINADSGRQSAPRHIEPGRGAIKRCLYMAALTAMKANPVLAAFAARLRATGHPFKCVATAVMRKLVVILNAVLRDGQPWAGARVVPARAA